MILLRRRSRSLPPLLWYSPSVSGDPFSTQLHSSPAHWKTPSPLDTPPHPHSVNTSVLTPQPCAGATPSPTPDSSGDPSCWVDFNAACITLLQNQWDLFMWSVPLRDTLKGQWFNLSPWRLPSPQVILESIIIPGSPVQFKWIVNHCYFSKQSYKILRLGLKPLLKDIFIFVVALVVILYVLFQMSTILTISPFTSSSSPDGGPLKTLLQPDWSLFLRETWLYLIIPDKLTGELTPAINTNPCGDCVTPALSSAVLLLTKSPNGSVSAIYSRNSLLQFSSSSL